MKKLEPHNSITVDSEAGRFSEPIPASAEPLQARADDPLEELKQRLLQEITCPKPDASTSSWLRRAAEEATSLAWSTPFPLLVLPELLFEKAAEACLRSQRQRDIRKRSVGLISLAE